MNRQLPTQPDRDYEQTGARKVAQRALPEKADHFPVRSEFFPDLKSEIPCSVE
jgi:hypothetical protein